MKTKIAVGLNGFTYRAIEQKELSKSEKRNLRLDILEATRKINYDRLKSNKSTFLKSNFNLS